MTNDTAKDIIREQKDIAKNMENGERIAKALYHGIWAIIAMDEIKSVCNRYKKQLVESVDAIYDIMESLDDFLYETGQDEEPGANKYYQED